MQKPLVSILIPFKNTERFFEECLNSIVLQTFKDWEVVAVNDGSQDNSLNIAENFGNKDSRFLILQNNGTGIIDALRLAYANSNGSMITRMDADDIMVPNKLKIMVNDLQNFGLGGIALGKVKYFAEYGINDGYHRYENWLNQLTESGNNFSEIYKECVIPSPCWMVHREDLDACQAFEPNRYPEDYDLAFRFYKAGLIPISSKKVLHHWRDYSNRTSRTSEHYAQNYFLEIKLHYFLQLEYVSKKPMVLWGAGNKGKKVARLLAEKEIPFFWVCDNEKKIGKNIYGTKMHHFSTISTIKEPIIIITVANESEQELIKTYLAKLKLQFSKDFYFFC